MKREGGDWGTLKGKKKNCVLGSAVVCESVRRVSAEGGLDEDLDR